SRRRHTRSKRDWSSDVCSSDLTLAIQAHHSVQLFLLAVVNELVRIGQYQSGVVLLHRAELFEHSSPCTPHACPVFERDNRLMTSGHLFDELDINGFNKTHINNGGINFIGHLQSLVEQGTKTQYRYRVAMTADHGFANRHGIKACRHQSTYPRTTWITYRGRARILVTCIEQQSRFVFIRRRTDD